MEQSGRNQWQSVANGKGPKTPQSGENRCRRLRPVAVTPNGKEGVDGSSPSEGFEKPLQIRGLLSSFVAFVGDTRSNRGRTG